MAHFTMLVVFFVSSAIKHVCDFNGNWLILIFKLNGFIFMLYLLGVIIAKGVNISLYSDQDLKVVMDGDAKGIRLMKDSENSKGSVEDSWIVSGEQTKIQNTSSEAFICGSEDDSSLMPCKEEETEFKIIRDDDKIYFKAENGMCMAKGESDEASGGHYLKLSKCDLGDDQAFKINQPGESEQPRKSNPLTRSSLHHVHNHFDQNKEHYGNHHHVEGHHGYDGKKNLRTSRKVDNFMKDEGN